ncbi:hypothetical protein M3Y94_00395500 [Aphelenchoides besseyi]|nr:hypothetical protein M3Y94_00395500 [Aphelenchoides besseyi]
MGDHALIFSCIGSESAQHVNHGSSSATSGFGLDSSFLHLMSDANNSQSVNYKTAMCRLFLLGNCSKGNFCSFAHGDHELRPSPNIGFCHPLYRTKPCRKYHYTGICEFGNNCFYLHPGMISQSSMDSTYRGDGWTSMSNNSVGFSFNYDYPMIDYSYGQPFVPMENDLSSCMNAVGFPFFKQQPTTSTFEDAQSPHEDLSSPIEFMEQTEYQEDELDAMDFDSIDEVVSVTSEESSCFEGTVENVVFSVLPKEDDDKTPWASATTIGSSLNSDDSRVMAYEHRRLPRVLHQSINFNYPMRSNNNDLFFVNPSSEKGEEDEDEFNQRVWELSLYLKEKKSCFYCT